MERATFYGVRVVLREMGNAEQADAG